MTMAWRFLPVSALCLAVLAAAPLSADPAFTDRTGALPMAHTYTGGWAHFVGGGVAVFDCNDDARPDIFAAGGTSAAQLYINRSDAGGDIAFALGDVFAPGGAGDVRDATGAYPLDIDGDGRLDLMILRNGPNLALIGQGGCRFEQAPDALNLDPGDAWTTAFSATWEADAALPTLAFGNYVDADDPDGPFGTCDTNWLIRPDFSTGDAAFGAPVPLDPGFCSLSMLFSDWRRDGTPMLRISNDRQYYVRDGYEQMWTLTPLRELDAADGWARMQLWGMGIASRDLTGDGLPEVMLTSMGDQMLMANDGAGFATVPFNTGTFAQRPFTGGDGRPSTGWHAEFGDIDNDGRPDLFIAKGNVDQMPGMAMADPNNLLMQQPDGTFTEMADVAGVASIARSRGAALADLNGDGLLDIVVVNRRAPMEIWQNATADAGGWARIVVGQPGPNSRAVGAIVEVRTDAGIQTQEITVGGGHAGGSALPLHFGLGDAEAAQARVVWPDGSVSPWRMLRRNETLAFDRSEP